MWIEQFSDKSYPSTKQDSFSMSSEALEAFENKMEHLNNAVLHSNYNF